MKSVSKILSSTSYVLQWTVQPVWEIVNIKVVSLVQINPIYWECSIGYINLSWLVQGLAFMTRNVKSALWLDITGLAPILEL